MGNRMSDLGIAAEVAQLRRELRQLRSEIREPGTAPAPSPELGEVTSTGPLVIERSDGTAVTVEQVFGGTGTIGDPALVVYPEDAGAVAILQGSSGGGGGGGIGSRYHRIYGGTVLTVPPRPTSGFNPNMSLITYAPTLVESQSWATSGTYLSTTHLRLDAGAYGITLWGGLIPPSGGSWPTSGFVDITLQASEWPEWQDAVAFGAPWSVADRWAGSGSANASISLAAVFRLDVQQFIFVKPRNHTDDDLNIGDFFFHITNLA